MEIGGDSEMSPESDPIFFLLLELHVAAVVRQPVGPGWHRRKVEEQWEALGSPKQGWS